MVQRPFRRRGVGCQTIRRLLADLEGRAPTVKVVNVEHTDHAMRQLLLQAGFTVYTRQHEMELEIG